MLEFSRRRTGVQEPIKPEVPVQPSIMYTAREFARGLQDTAAKWDTLTPQAQQEALLYYGYMALVGVGVPAAFLLALTSRL